MYAPIQTLYSLFVLVVISFLGYISYASNDYSSGTLVEYVAKGSESYSVTVPAKLAPGGSGTVTLNVIELLMLQLIKLLNL